MLLAEQLELQRRVPRLDRGVIQRRARIQAWIEEYNTVRRHSAIGMISPAAFEAAEQNGQAA